MQETGAQVSQFVEGGSTFDAVIVGLLVLIALLVCAAMYLQYRQRTRQLTPDEAREVILHAEERAQAIISEAAAEARQTRLAIERERTEALNEDRKEIDRFLDAYRFHLDKTIKDLSYGVEKEHMRVTSKFVEALQGIEDRVALNAEEAKHSMESFTGQSSTLFDRLTYQIENVERGIQHLAVALEEAAVNESGKNAELVRQEMQKIGKETASSITQVAKELESVLRVGIEKEFASITEELTNYRESRMRLVDERIILLIEETAQIALQRKLSMQDQSDLVMRSLDEAKERGIFV